MLPTEGACSYTVNQPTELYLFLPCSTMRLTALLSMAAKVVIPKDYRYGTHRPWTEAAKRRNPPGKRRRKVFVEPIESHDWTVFKGDTVR